MLVPSPRPVRLVDSLALAVLALASLALVGCKQDIGQRCEQGSDCSSGYCGDSPLGMVSVMGRVCTPPPTAGPVSDASTVGDAADAPAAAGDAASDGASDGASDAGSDGASDAGSDGASDGASDAGSDAAGGEASPHDGGSDVIEAGVETSLGDVMTEAGAGG